MKFRNKIGGHRLLKKDITFESVVVDVENCLRKSIKRSLNEYGRENVINIYIAD